MTDGARQDRRRARQGRGARVRGRAAPTCLGEADDLGDRVVGRGPGARLPVQAGDLHAAVLPHLAGVQLAQRRDHGRLGHGVRDVGPVPHLQPAQDVPLHRLQEIPVHLARLLGPPEAAGGACVLRGAAGGGRRGRGGRGAQQEQPAGQQRGQHPPASRPVHGGGAGGRAGGRPGAPQGARLQAAPLRALRGAEGAVAAKLGGRNRSAQGGSRGGGRGRPGKRRVPPGRRRGEAARAGTEGEVGGGGGGTGLACTERARLHGGGGRQQVRGWLRSPGRREGERGASRRCEGIRGAGERRRRSAPVPRVASEGHPRAQSLVVHRSLRQVRAGRGEELSSPASLRGVREINEADLYTIQFIAWKEGGEKCHLYPPAHSAPARQSVGAGL